MAEQTEGFSGREIAKLAIAWQAAAYGTSNSTFNVELMDEVLEVSVASIMLKVQLYKITSCVFFSKYQPFVLLVCAAGVRLCNISLELNKSASPDCPSFFFCS